MLRSKTLPSSSVRARSLTAPSPQPPPQKKTGSKGPCSQARGPSPQLSPQATSSVRDLVGKLESPFPPLFQLFPQLSQQGTLVAGQNSLTPLPPFPQEGTLQLGQSPVPLLLEPFFSPRFITNGLLKWKLENKEMFYFYRAILRGSEGRL